MDVYKLLSKTRHLGFYIAAGASVIQVNSNKTDRYERFH